MTRTRSRNTLYVEATGLQENRSGFWRSSVLRVIERGNETRVGTTVSPELRECLLSSQVDRQPRRPSGTASHRGSVLRRPLSH